MGKEHEGSHVVVYMLCHRGTPPFWLLLKHSCQTENFSCIWEQTRTRQKYADRMKTGKLRKLMARKEKATVEGKQKKNYNGIV